jgi:hypothetical protein
MRKLGVNYRTAWLLHNKIVQVLSEHEKPYVLREKFQLDDAYKSGEQNGDNSGNVSENNVSIVAAVSLDEAGHRIHLKVAKVETFSLAANADWAQDALAHCTARPERFLRGAELGT